MVSKLLSKQVSIVGELFALTMFAVKKKSYLSLAESDCRPWLPHHCLLLKWLCKFNWTKLNYELNFLFKGPSLDLLSGNRKVRHFYKSSRTARHLSAVRESLILNSLRGKRSALFSTGVRACPQENMAEVIASHKSYYKLRGWISHIAMRETKPKIRAKFVFSRASLHKSFLACLLQVVFWDRNRH